VYRSQAALLLAETRFFPSWQGCPPLRPRFLKDAPLGEPKTGFLGPLSPRSQICQSPVLKAHQGQCAGQIENYPYSRAPPADRASLHVRDHLRPQSLRQPAKARQQLQLRRRQPRALDEGFAVERAEDPVPVHPTTPAPLTRERPPQPPLGLLGSPPQSQRTAAKSTPGISSNLPCANCELRVANSELAIPNPAKPEPKASYHQGTKTQRKIKKGFVSLCLCGEFSCQMYKNFIGKVLMRNS
jgi:hypothetical protein